MTVLLMRTSEERFRGRVMGARMLAIYTLPLGLLIAGALIPAIGFHAMAALFVGSGVLLTLVIGLMWRSELLPRDAVANRR